jgi:hypothetical protein
MEKKEIIQKFLQSGYLISPEFFENNNFEVNNLVISLDQNFQDKKGPLIIDNQVLNLISSTHQEFSWVEFEKAKVLFEKGRDEESYKNFIKLISKKDLDQQTIPENVCISLAGNRVEEHDVSLALAHLASLAQH